MDIAVESGSFREAMTIRNSGYCRARQRAHSNPRPEVPPVMRMERSKDMLMIVWLIQW